jgi:hypothetical protein
MNKIMKPIAIAVKIAASTLNRRLFFSFISAMLKVEVKSNRITMKLIDKISPIGDIIKVYYNQDYYSFGFIMIEI